MKKTLLLSAAVMSLALLGGCAQVNSVVKKMDYTTGTQVTDQQLQSFKKGKTTQDQVVAAIGYPASKAEVTGKEVWSYPYTLIAAMPFAPNKQETTVFEWNAKGVLLNFYKAGGSAGGSGNALLDAANIK
ncbi:outer membrane protein assembly factor BamE [Pseudomonas serbica]|jgi:outer membrane protein assembly factor BamE|uniref:outer membrane protein assembly factor BamE n=1 Tax=Pseudomonas serbica TaxID=2965074 RepID=UPI00237A4A31|nr:outer membrane protein assembly factor BamE [Pseudomonas serbica]